MKNFFVRVKNDFHSLDGMYLKSGDELVVDMNNIFWIKRQKDKDIEVLKRYKKEKPIIENQDIKPIMKNKRGKI